MNTATNPHARRVELIGASPKDGDLLLGLIEKYYAYDQIPFDRKRIQPALEQMLREPEWGRAWLIRNEGQIIGYAILTSGFDLEFGGQFGLLTDLYLEPAYRSRGLGTETLHQIEQKCTERGYHSLELQVESDNTEAQGLYRKMGFRSHSRIPMSKLLS